MAQPWSAATAGGDQLESVEEIKHEIDFQKILLGSLEDSTGDTTADRERIEAEIKSLYKRLKEFSRQGPSPHLPNPTAPVFSSHSRKRSFGELSSSHGFPDAKSRKTTLMGLKSDDTFDYDSDDSSVIDYTMVDEDSSTRKKQREREEQLRRRKEQEDADARYAILLSEDGDDGDDVDSGMPGPSMTSSSIPSSAHSGSYAVRTPNAFDRIRDYPGPSYYHHRQNAPAVKAEAPTPSINTETLPLYGLHSSVKTEAPPSYGMHQIPNLPTRANPATAYPGFTYASTSFNLPPMGNQSFNHINPSSSPFATGFSTGDHPHSSITVLGTAPGTVYGTVSGPSIGSGIGLSLLDDEDNDSDDNGLPLPQNAQDFLHDLERDDPGKMEQQLQNLLANTAPEVDIPEDQLIQTPPSLKVDLYPYQKIALKWMHDKEKDDSKRGGILADVMGLGKTISTLALMVSRPATVDPEKPRCKTNLIVTPVALIKQWESEILRKVKHANRLSVLIVHGSKKYTYEELRRHDVVITTYGKVSSELKHREELLRKINEGGDSTNAKRQMNTQCPFLGTQSMFYRVILDEAQYIKNRSAKVARATGTIQAKYRWCLTGTPMMNNISEVASLILFLRIGPYDNPRLFTSTFGCLSARRHNGNRVVAMRKFQALLSRIMLRRTKSSTINGKPIIVLPPKTEIVDHVVFDEEEKKYYDDLERDSQVRFSKFLKTGTVGKKYQQVLVLLLRLRQACCHPYLHITDLESGGCSELTEDIMVQMAKDLKPDVVRRLKESDGFECPICYDPVMNPSIMLPCGHDTCSECFITLTSSAERSNMQAGNEGGGVPCPKCRGPIKADKVITFEVFRSVHMPETFPPALSGADEEYGNDDDESSGSDSGDKTDTDSEDDDDVDNLGNLRDFIVDDDELSGDEVEDVPYIQLAQKVPKTEDVEDSKGVVEETTADQPNDVQGIVDGDFDDTTFEEDMRKAMHLSAKAQSAEIKGKRKKRGKGKGKKKKTKKKEEEIPQHAIAELRHKARNSKEARKTYMRYLRKNWQDSAKVTKCKELILDIQASGEKTIVFSQWTLLLDLLEIPIRHELKLDYRRFDGSMSRVDRDNAVRDFMEEPGVKVMLISLKAGNAGLNLTSASQVIIMDPFWNPYVEMQGIDRAHRIGQERHVKIHRVLIEGTVEDRIVDLQNRKRELVEAALDEKASKNLMRLSEGDLTYLFGLGSRASR